MSLLILQQKTNYISLFYTIEMFLIQELQRMKKMCFFTILINYGEIKFPWQKLTFFWLSTIFKKTNMYKTN